MDPSGINFFRNGFGGTSPTNTYWAGTFDKTASWNTNSATYADFTVGAAGTFAQTQNNGFGTVTRASSNLPGITFTPSSSSAVYLVTYRFSAYNTAASVSGSIRLTDGTSIVGTAALYLISAVGYIYTDNVMGIYAPATASAVTLKLQGAASSGTITLANADIENVLEIALVQIV